jgi:hypothetical protein
MNRKALIPMINTIHTFLTNYLNRKTSALLLVLVARPHHPQPIGAEMAVLTSAQLLL